MPYPFVTFCRKYKLGTESVQKFINGIATVPPLQKHPRTVCSGVNGAYAFFSSWYSFSVLTFQTAVLSVEPFLMQLTASNAVTMEWSILL